MKLKKSVADQIENEGALPQPGGAFISKRFRNPAEEEVVVSNTGDKIGGICAIIACLLLAAVTALLYLQWDVIAMA